MKSKYLKLRALFSKPDIQELYSYMQRIFSEDDWILEEYSGGLNSHLLPDESLEEVQDLAETALQVSAQVSTMLLEKAVRQ